MQIGDALRRNADEICGVLGRLSSSRTRFLIIACLSEGECSVNELADRIGMPQSAVSQHLRKLRGAQLVCSRRSQKRIFYSLANGRVRAIMAALALVIGLGDEGTIDRLTARFP